MTMTKFADRKPISLSVFFPVYNEAENIKEAVVRTVETVAHSPYVSEYEIILVNDGSVDESKHIADALAEIYPQVRVVNHDHNRGYGAALKTGIAEARMEYVFFTDADLQFDILELQNLLVHADTYPIVIGYRAPRRDPFMRLLNAWVWNILNRLFFGLRVRDIDCAFKLFRRDLVQRLRLASNSAMISAETLLRLQKRGIPIKEVPVSHMPRSAGSPTGAKPTVVLRALTEMIALYRSELGLASQKEALRFLSVGIVNTLLDATVYVLLTRGTLLFATRLSVAKFFSFLVGTLSSLFLNRSWTFGVQGRITLAEITRFYGVVAISLSINVGTMTLLLRLGLYDLYAFLIATVVTFALNFVLSKLWVFTRSNPATIAEPTYAPA